jgi:5-formyltetrahydrofolate cyclo-ligase
MTDLATLRRSLKQARQALSTDERATAAAQAIERIRRLPCYRRAQRLAAFIGSKGELDPSPLMQQAQRDGKAVYLPVLHPFIGGRLWFCRWHDDGVLRANRFGIPEPIPNASSLIAARDLDLVVMPLLGFDEQCHRLGMGGGYYDRTFAFTRRLQVMRGPLLIGFAHEMQRLQTLDARPWDIQPHLIATNARLYRCRS